MIISVELRDSQEDRQCQVFHFDRHSAAQMAEMVVFDLELVAVEARFDDWTELVVAAHSEASGDHTEIGCNPISQNFDRKKLHLELEQP